MLERIKKNKKGFTLAELLIVIAIIGVLVAIAIPVFTGALARAQLATDAANVRAAYAEYAVAQLMSGAEPATVAHTQFTTGIITTGTTATYAAATGVLTLSRTGAANIVVNFDPDLVTS